jgi:hypothetical protein
VYKLATVARGTGRAKAVYVAIVTSYLNSDETGSEKSCVVRWGMLWCYSPTDGCRAAADLLMKALKFYPGMHKAFPQEIRAICRVNRFVGMLDVLSKFKALPCMQACTLTCQIRCPLRAALIRRVYVDGECYKSPTFTDSKSKIKINVSFSTSLNFIETHFHFRNWGISVSIVSDYRLDDRASIPSRDKGFFL